ncbi:MAG UNVERIFIED_CONTAM: tetratricopeptide repeat protein [Anaerolineae bacterium]
MQLQAICESSKDGLQYLLLLSVKNRQVTNLGTQGDEHVYTDFVDDLVEQSVAKGKDYIAKEHLLNAKTLLKQSRRVAPDNVKVLELLGLALIKQVKYEDAIEVYGKVLDIDENHLDAINNLAYSYSNLGERDKAIELLRKGIKVEPNKDSFWYHLAIQYKEQGNFERAFEIYEEALALIPESSDLNYHYGVTLAESGNYAKALEKYNRALELDPSHAPSHWNRSLTLLVTGNYKAGFEER